MKLKFENNIYDVDASIQGEQIISKINANTLLFKKGSLTNNLLSLTEINDNKYYHFYTAEDENHIYINCEGDCIIFDKIKDEEKSFVANDNETGNKQIVLPPMPGTIVKIMVKKDQKVNEGDALIIVEAMKMETTLYAEINGVVTEVNVQNAEQVDADKVLMIVEKEEN
jgi:biotin carboxyl carrier protein